MKRAALYAGVSAWQSRRRPVRAVHKTIPHPDQMTIENSVGLYLTASVHLNSFLWTHGAARRGEVGA